MKRTLLSYGVNFAVFEIDGSEATSEIQIALKQRSGISTVPNLFIKGESVGGCTDVKALEHSGKFLGLVAPYIGKEVAKSPELTSLGFFWFPETVNAHVVRLVALFTFIYAVLCTILWDYKATKWAVLALLIDTVARFIYGSGASVLGMIATAYLAKVPPRYTAGPPKQFAAFCAVLFCMFATGLYLGDHPDGGSVLMAILAACAFSEAIFDFCFGCWFFSIGIANGFISPNVYRPYLNLVEDRKWAYNYMNEKRTFPKATNEHVLLPGQKDPSPADLITKNRLELEYKLQDSDVLRHTRVEFFAVPMAIAALAYAFKLTDQTAKLGTNFNTGWAYQILSIVSVVIGGFLMLIYFARTFLHFNKVVKEWFNPISGNYFSAITITITLYGLLLLPVNVSGGGALIWIGAVGQMLISVLKVSDLVFSRISDEFLNPGIMMAPVGNYITALAFATYDAKYNGPDRHSDMNYLFISRLWYAVASLFAIVLFTITFKRALHDHHSDDRVRPTLWIWLATSSVAGPAYLAVNNYSSETGLDVTFQSLWCISLFFCVLNGVGWIRNFHSYPQDMSIWVVPFSLSAFAISTITYKLQMADQLFTVLSIFTTVMAIGSISVTGMYTLGWAFNHSLFVPRQKWGPASVMKLTHEAFRFAVPKIATTLNGLDTATPAAIEKFIEEFAGFIAVFHAHSQHEDDILFPTVRRFFPGLNPSADAEHERLDAELAKMEELVKVFYSKKGNEAIEAGKNLVITLKKSFPAWGDYLLDHLRNEETTFTAVVRKYVPVEYQMEIVQKMFDRTSGEEWRKVLPFVVSHLPVPVWKARFVKCLVWANPTRAQEIGLMLYPNVDSVTWLFVAREVPEIVPRGVTGHHRIY
ncbi:DUF4395 family protein [archaeon]|nr:MAG: DUF4395 family protein [archaeon]